MENEIPDYYDMVIRYHEIAGGIHTHKRAEKPADTPIDDSYYDMVIRYHELTSQLLEIQYPELRGNGQNYIKDEKGRFAGSRPGGGSGSISGKGIDNSAESDIIKSGKLISGALNPYSDRADAHAERYYESVRHMTTDVSRIAKIRDLVKMKYPKSKILFSCKSTTWETGMLILMLIIKWLNHGKGLLTVKTYSHMT